MAKRTNHIALVSLPWAQGVVSSNLAAPTKIIPSAAASPTGSVATVTATHGLTSGTCGMYNCVERLWGRVEMARTRVCSTDRLRLTIVGIVMLSLVVTLATRTFQVSVSSSTTVQSRASQTMRQHMDRDAFSWAAPVLQFVALQVPRSQLCVAPAGPAVSTPLREENLYNRPPPGI